MRPRSREAMHAEVAGACRPFRTEEARLNALRRVKRRELCRIGLRDLLGDADLVTTTQELSELADACLAQALATVEPALHERYGRPGARRRGRPADAHRVRGHRARQARRGRAQLLVGHRPLLRLRGRGRDGRAGGRVEPDVLRAPGRAADRGADRDDGGGHGLPGRPPAPARGDRRPARAPARRVPRLPRDARGPLGAPGADQGAGGGRGRARGAGVPRPGARDRLPLRARARGARRDPGDEEPDRPAAPRARPAGAPRQARRGRDPRHRVPHPGAPAPLRRAGSLAPRAEQPARPPPARRARVPVLGGVGAARPRLRLPPDDRAPPADPPRAPDAHAARRSGASSRSSRGASGTRGTGRPPRTRSSRDYDRTRRTVRAAFEGFFDASGRAVAGGAAVGRGGRRQPSASPIRSARGRTSGSSGRGRRWWRCPPPSGPRSRTLLPATLDALRDGAGSRRGPRRARALRRRRGAADGLPRPARLDARRCSAGCSPSSRGRSGSRRR